MGRLAIPPSLFEFIPSPTVPRRYLDRIPGVRLKPLWSGQNPPGRLRAPFATAAAIRALTPLRSQCRRVLNEMPGAVGAAGPENCCEMI